MFTTAWNVTRSLADGLLQLTFPNVCWICQQTRAELDGGICDGCKAPVTFDPHPTCPRCSSSVGPFATLDGKCASCRPESLAFDQAFRMGPYEGVLRDAILQMKQPTGESLAEVVADAWVKQMLPRLAALKPNVVTPTPLHWTRRWQRGFNVSDILAAALADALAIPVRRCIRRIRRTPKQTQQDTPAKRRLNVHNAFAARPDSKIAGASVVLVDDVLTTGATAHEAARALRTLKAARIVVAVLAHGK